MDEHIIKVLNEARMNEEIILTSPKAEHIIIFWQQSKMIYFEIAIKLRGNKWKNTKKIKKLKVLETSLKSGF